MNPFRKTDTGLDVVRYADNDGQFVGMTPLAMPGRMALDKIRSDLDRINKLPSNPDHIRGMIYTLTQHLDVMEDLLRSNPVDTYLLLRYALSAGHIYCRLQLVEAEPPALIGRKVHAATKRPRHKGRLSEWLHAIPDWRNVPTLKLARMANRQGLPNKLTSLRRAIDRLKKSDSKA